MDIFHRIGYDNTAYGIDSSKNDNTKGQPIKRLPFVE